MKHLDLFNLFHQKTCDVKITFIYVALPPASTVSIVIEDADQVDRTGG